jgi:hypothetical protein
MLKAIARRRKKTGRSRISPSKPWPRTGEIVPIYFEVDEKVVSIVLEDGTRAPLFPSERITGPSVFPTVRENLQQTIATIMEDMGAGDNGVC